MKYNTAVCRYGKILSLENVAAYVIQVLVRCVCVCVCVCVVC